MKMIEVVLINWKRPKNIVRIVDALRGQTIPCTITLCDNHPAPEYALLDETLAKIDRVFRWEHNLGAYSRYLPIAALDHPYTFLIDDDLLPGRRCLETYLETALELGDFGVLGQYGRIITPDERYRLELNIFPSEKIIETDFIIRAYFVKTENLHNVIRFRWELGYFEEPLPEDDLLMGGAMKYYENLRCFMMPAQPDKENLLDGHILDDDFALYSRPDHLYKRNEFVDRLLFYGWEQLYSTGSVLEEHVTPQRARFTVCIANTQSQEWKDTMISRLLDWEACQEIIFLHDDPVIQETQKRFSNTFIIDGTFANETDRLNAFAAKVTGSHVLWLDEEEYYESEDLTTIGQDAENHPSVDLFVFNTSQHPARRSYFHKLKNENRQFIGGNWNTPPLRIFKWEKDTSYADNSGTTPVRSDGQLLHYRNHRVVTRFTRATCTHMVNYNPEQDSSVPFFDYPCK